MKITRRGLFAGIAAIFGAKAIPAKCRCERIARTFHVPVHLVHASELQALAEKAFKQEFDFIDEEAPWIDWRKA